MQNKELQEKLGKETKYSKYYLLIIEKAKLENRKKLKKNHKDYVYYENHHILPKSIFPEFKDLRTNKWNGVLLTAKEHFIVHALIWKHYKKLDLKKQEWQMANALLCFKGNGPRNKKFSKVYNSRLYEHYKLQNSLKHNNLSLADKEQLNKKTKHVGSKNGAFKKRKIYIPKLNKVIIFDENSIPSNFEHFLNHHNLPNGLYNSAANQGKPLYTSKVGITTAINQGYEDYIGAYALLDGDKQKDEYKDYDKLFELSLKKSEKGIIKRKETLANNPIDTKIYGSKGNKHPNFKKRIIIIPLLNKEIIFDGKEFNSFYDFLKHNNLPLSLNHLKYTNGEIWTNRNKTYKLDWLEGVYIKIEK